ncbi:alpha/beta-hydrolase [Aspergillus heteromorphus CBS 117.55]|uniref:Alpha/beta-hydrolase n=1 Tax=Aspergillus heteromorphus CBS 117.55 TaxID=1448321 RepID=A0A317W805_9EURO|nr:alpha/beta-hydrolase [Aspergillus heteromorphus CBS 117.55]PWY82015.1 alpha/beta-hydrolase [Aspergillus heteromorphus CBS 117.55]
MKLLGSLLLGAPLALALYEPPYYANLTWEPPRTLSNWSNLTVETQTGTFIGFLNDTFPNVRQFLHVPYAKPPTGDLRWMPPQKLDPSSRKYDSTRYGPGCPQYVTAPTSMWNEYAPSNLLLSLGEDLNQGSVAWSTSEDCLSLAVWTPAYANRTSKLPVALFVTGGGGITGGIDIPSQLPPPWVSRSQEHIVVTINYRSNIFGNPKSRALKETSLTLLDVRAAVEWVKENIEAFGGDDENIMLWGQSQGAALTHLYTLAFPDDPLAVKFGVISQPPSVTIDLDTAGDVYEDFDIVAKALGCNYGDDAEAELECMRLVSWVQIEEYINRYSGSPSIAFTNYIPDEKYIFSNESERYATGQVARGPSIRSDAAREDASDNTTSVMISEGEWDCRAAMDTALRRSIGLDTYRYFWGGNFSNISPVGWLGAYHWSDLLLIFGTYRDQAGDIPQLEVDTSESMQDHFLAFLKDPNTVNTTVGWPAFDPEGPNGGEILEFGKGDPVHTITGDWLDGGCYNSSIPFRIWG